MKFNIAIPPQAKKWLGKLKPIVRHHYFIYALLLLGGLLAAMYAINMALTAPQDTVYQQQQEKATLKGSFDQATIKKIEDLNTSGEQSTAPPPPSGVRTNPFAE